MKEERFAEANFDQRKSRAGQELTQIRHEQTLDYFRAKARELDVMTQGLADRLRLLQGQWTRIQDARDPNLGPAIDRYLSEIREIHSIFLMLEKKASALKQRDGFDLETRLQTQLAAIQERDPAKWKKLYDVLKTEVGSGVLRGSQKTYTFQELVDFISRAKQDPSALRFLTNAGGLHETVLRFLKTDQTEHSRFEQTVGGQELTSFFRFVQKYRNRIYAEAKSGKMYGDIFYDLYYTEDLDRSIFRDGDPKTEHIKRVYEKQAADVMNYFLEISRKYMHGKHPPISPSISSMRDGWIYFKLNGGAKVDREPNGGRIYLNVKPEYLPAFYKEALPRFYRAGVAVDAKISQKANAEDLNRLDKMILYFKETDEQKILAVVSELYQSHPEYFLDGTPHFTKPLRNVEGKPMKGVSFGEQPHFGGVLSFGEIRAKILGEVFSVMEKNRIEPDDPRVQILFEHACKRFDIDPVSPAFNLGAGSFRLIRNQSA
ncbi:MAG TPA: T3SS effector HopA1 family protein [Patescibacteria group bacterium]|nr:T3SS effector HopA1 family protein [Patescibacteria group bacterium]